MKSVFKTIIEKAATFCLLAIVLTIAWARTNYTSGSKLSRANKDMNETIETEVIIVGAGPTGLALACQLARYAVDFVIFDQKKGVIDVSKAVAVQARTLEIYEQIGLAERAVQADAIARAANIVANGEIRASLDLSDIGKNLSPFPFALLLEQSKNERLLDDYLQQHGKTIEWQTELESLTQTDDSVTAIIKNANGETKEIRAKFLVGCDGAKSSVRHQLDFKFEGSTINALFYVADVEMEFPAGNHDEIYVSFGADSFVALFPLKESNRWRIVGNVPEEEIRFAARLGQTNPFSARLANRHQLPPERFERSQWR